MQGKIRAMSIQSNPIPRAFNRSTALSLTAGYYLTFLALGAATASLGPTLPGLAAQTNSALQAVSFLFSARSFGYLTGSMLGGRAVDRLPGNRLLAVMIALMAVMMALVPLMPWLILLTIVLLLLGVAEGALDVSANTLLVWLHRHNVAPYLNGLHFFFGFGALLSPLLIGQILVATDGIAWSYWLLGLAMLPAAMLIFPLPSPSAVQTQSESQGKKARPLLVVLVASVLLLYVGAEAGYGGWIYSYALAETSLAPVQAAALTSGFWAALTFGRLLSIPLASRLRPSTFLILDYVLCLASISLLVIWPASTLVLWLATIGLGLGMASIFPTIVALAGRRMGVTGAVTAWLFVGAGLGGMTLPALVGQFFERIGPQVLVLSVIAALFVGLLTLSLVFLLTRQPQKEAPSGATR